MSKQNLKKVHSNSRAAIIDLLILCNDGAFANEIVPARLSRSEFSVQDKAMITNVVYNALRLQIRIDNALAKISKRKLKDLDDIVLNALRSVVAQIHLGFDAYGVVNETVSVLPFAYKSFVNALSRKIVDLHKKSKFFIDETEDVLYSMPKWIIDEMKNTFEEKYLEFLPLYNLVPKISFYDLKTGETIENIDGEIAENDAIKSGDSIVVDKASQLIINSLPLKADDKVLDLCAAPGGKSFIMASKVKRVFSNDIAFSRMKKFKDTKERTNSKNVFGLVSDGTKSCFGDKTFDVVLVDAPCSGLGVLRRRADARNNIEKSIVDELVELQKQIISSSINLVKKDGLFVYSLCTFTQRETTDMVDWIKETFANLELVEIDIDEKFVVEKSGGYLIEPGEDHDSMFFVAFRSTLD